MQNEAQNTNVGNGGNIVPPFDNSHIEDPTRLPFFDSTPGLTPGERNNVEATVAAIEKSKEERKVRKERKKTRSRRKAKVQGAFILPVYLATYNLMNECNFRFRSLPAYAKAHGREVESLLLDICTDLQLIYWQVIPRDNLPSVFKNMLKVLVRLRALRDTRKITKHDFGCLCRYAGPMTKHMRQWNNSVNSDNEISDKVAWAIMTAESDIPGMYLAEEDRNTDGSPVEQEASVRE